jgi:hypothetical protein
MRERNGVLVPGMVGHWSLTGVCVMHAHRMARDRDIDGPTAAPVCCVDDRGAGDGAVDIPSGDAAADEEATEAVLCVLERRTRPREPMCPPTI